MPMFLKKTTLEQIITLTIDISRITSKPNFYGAINMKSIPYMVIHKSTYNLALNKYQRLMSQIILQTNYMPTYQFHYLELTFATCIYNIDLISKHMC
jgi:hypothetical protein